jgi:hypothetical protein
MKRVFLIIALASTLTSAAADNDGICAQLAAFESASLAHKDQSAPRRDWIEFRWTGAWLSEEGWGWECTHSGSDAAQAFCAWLGPNTSMEFHQYLPRRILACHGSRFSTSIGSMTQWIQTVPIYPEASDEHMLLEIALGGHKGNDVIRYSVFVGPAAEEKQPLPPLIPPSNFTGK